MLYTVRQYRPAFVEGFENAVVEHVDHADLMNPDVLPWLKNFMHDDVADYAFVEFYTETPYASDHKNPWADEIFVSARYNNGKHWVAAIALPEKA